MPLEEIFQKIVNFLIFGKSFNIFNKYLLFYRLINVCFIMRFEEY